MSDFDTLFAADQLPSLYAAFGKDATVKRGAAAAVPVRIIVDRGQESIGEHGRVYGLIDTVSFQVAEWEPVPGDVVSWTDHLGSHTKTVEASLSNDGLEAKVVVHG